MTENSTPAEDIGGDVSDEAIIAGLEAGAGAGHDPNFLPMEAQRAMDEQDSESVAEIIAGLEAGAGAGHDPNFLPMEAERALEHRRHGAS
jgi:hypothetical protein